MARKKKIDKEPSEIEILKKVVAELNALMNTEVDDNGYGYPPCLSRTSGFELEIYADMLFIKRVFLWCDEDIPISAGLPRRAIGWVEKSITKQLKLYRKNKRLLSSKKPKDKKLAKALRESIEDEIQEEMKKPLAGYDSGDY